MCGIAGYFCFGEDRPSKEILSNLLVNTEIRGRDSTGVSFVKDGALVVHKSPFKGSEFVTKNEDWLSLRDDDIPKYMIMHCRATTQGSEKNNMNNHPVFRDGLAIVHNGVIYNDDDLYKEFKFDRDAQVDTEIILALLESKREENWLSRVKQIDNLRGGFAVGAIDTAIPNTLCLFRHSNPIVIAVDTKNNILYFASTKEIIKNSTTYPYKNIVNVYRKMPYRDLPDDSGIIIGEEGSLGKFSISPKKYVTQTTRSKCWNCKFTQQTCPNYAAYYVVAKANNCGFFENQFGGV